MGASLSPCVAWGFFVGASDGHAFRLLSSIEDRGEGPPDGRAPFSPRAFALSFPFTVPLPRTPMRNWPAFRGAALLPLMIKGKCLIAASLFPTTMRPQSRFSMCRLPRGCRVGRPLCRRTRLNPVGRYRAHGMPKRYRPMSLIS